MFATTRIAYARIAAPAMTARVLFATVGDTIAHISVRREALCRMRTLRTVVDPMVPALGAGAVRLESVVTSIARGPFAWTNHVQEVRAHR